MDGEVSEGYQEGGCVHAYSDEVGERRLGSRWVGSGRNVGAGKE